MTDVSSLLHHIPLPHNRKSEMRWRCVWNLYGFFIIDVIGIVVFMLSLRRLVCWLTIDYCRWNEFCFSRYFCWALKRRTALSITCECCLLLVFLRLVLNLQNSFLLLPELRGVGRQVGRSQEHVWLDWKWFP